MEPMNIRRIAGIVYAATTAVVVVFQFALALGAPWGAYAMGGAYPGQFPPAMRVAAFIQVGILLGFAGIVLARAGIALRAWERVSRWMVWVVVAFAALSLVLNLITPSAGERMLWAPVALMLLVCSLVVATGRKQ
jgi:hypothetical protein